MPAISASSAPSDAAAAPKRTIGSAHTQPEAAAVSARGASARCRRVGPERREHRDRDDGINGERQPEGEHDGPRNVLCGIAHLFAHRRDPGVARKREEEQSGGLQDAVAVGRPQVQVCEAVRAVRARPSRCHDHGESEQHDHHQHAGELCRALPSGGAASAANVIAIAAQLASLPMMNAQPATKPHHGPISARP